MHIRQFFVKSDNVCLPDPYKGTQVVNIPKDGTIHDLYAAIREKYGFNNTFVFYLLTNPLGMSGKRLDDLVDGGQIPDSVDNIYIKAPIMMGAQPRARQDTLIEPDP
jgi:hypothetical protein